MRRYSTPVLSPGGAGKNVIYGILLAYPIYIHITQVEKKWGSIQFSVKVGLAGPKNSHQGDEWQKAGFRDRRK